MDSFVSQCWRILCWSQSTPHRGTQRKSWMSCMRSSWQSKTNGKLMWVASFCSILSSRFPLKQKTNDIIVHINRKGINTNTSISYTLIWIRYWNHNYCMVYKLSLNTFVMWSLLFRFLCILRNNNNFISKILFLTLLQCALTTVMRDSKKYIYTVKSESR